jgi:pilus assembly protein CpaB
MNPQQRRGVIMMIIAALGAVAVFIALVVYVQSVSAEVGPRSTVYVATEYITPQMITSQEELAGQKASVPIAAGSWMQTDMIAPASALEDGQREISVNFEADTGINGRVAPGDTVDVIAAFAKERENEQGAESYRRADIPYNTAGILVRNAQVVSVGQPVDPNAAVGAADETGAQVAMVPVTFAVSVEDAGRLAYGESFAVNMRLMRSGNNETGTQVDEGATTFDDVDLQEIIGSDG